MKQGCVLVDREVPPRVYNLLNEGGSDEKWWEVRCFFLFVVAESKIWLLDDKRKILLSC